MQTRLRCLVVGLALVTLLLWLVTPAVAQQEGSTTFTVMLESLAMFVEPANIGLGIRSAGETFDNLQAGLPAITATNNSNVTVNFEIAGTNAQQTVPIPVNPSWLLDTFQGQERFRWGYSLAVSPAAFTSLPGPVSPTSAPFPTLGPAQPLAFGVSPGQPVVTYWQMGMPTGSIYPGQHAFNITIIMTP